MAARNRGLKVALVVLCIALAALASFYAYGYFSRRNESASHKAGREAREAFEKGKEILKGGVDKTGEAAKKGLEAGKEATQDFQKGWKEGGK